MPGSHGQKLKITELRTSRDVCFGVFFWVGSDFALSGSAVRNGKDLWSWNAININTKYICTVLFDSWLADSLRNNYHIKSIHTKHLFEIISPINDRTSQALNGFVHQIKVNHRINPQHAMRPTECITSYYSNDSITLATNTTCLILTGTIKSVHPTHSTILQR